MLIVVSYVVFALLVAVPNAESAVSRLPHAVVSVASAAAALPAEIIPESVPFAVVTPPSDVVAEDDVAAEGEDDREGDQ